MAMFPVPAPGQPAEPLTASQFAALIEELSEPEGYFWNDNFVSNEASYLHPISKLQELEIRGGVYLGVGPNQNLTYIAKLRPRYAFILDIRRQNLLQHLLFKALFHLSRDRAEFLSLLLSRPSWPDAGRKAYTIDDLVLHYRGVEPEPILFSRTRHRVERYLSKTIRVRLEPRDRIGLERIHQAFYRRGLSIKYDYIPVLTYGEFLLQTDTRGRKENFLNSDRDFQVLQRLHTENRIIPVVGDFSGTHALRKIGELLHRKGEKVTVFYTSNVEQYLLRSRRWHLFQHNLGFLPLAEAAVFIRTYWSSRIPHPERLPGFHFTQVVHWIRPFLDGMGEATPLSYYEMVTRDTIKLR